MNANTVITNWLSIVFDFVSSLNDYVIVEGVTFLGVILAIGLFSIIVDFFFKKILSGG